MKALRPRQGASTPRVLIPVLGALAAAFVLATPATAHAQNQLAFDLGADFPSGSSNDDGWGLGGRFGHEWDLLVLSLTPELDVAYHNFSGPADATTFAVMGGGRLGLGFVLEPSVFLHAGVGHLSGEATSHTSLAYDFGAALDVTALPVIAFGPHIAWSGIAGTSESGAFSWFELGGHVSFAIGR